MYRFAFGLVLLCLCCAVLCGCQRRTQQKAFPDFNPYAVSRIVFSKENGSHHIELLRKSCREWVVTHEGHTFMANREAVESFVTMIANCTLVPVKNTDVQETAASCVGTEVLIEANGTYRFWVKKCGENYHTSYIRREGDEQCVRCKPFLNTTVNLPLHKWIRNDIFDGKLPDVTSIAIKLHGEPMLDAQFDTRQRRWVSALPPHTPYPPGTVEKLYNFLYKMQMYSAELTGNTQKTGLDAPRLAVTVHHEPDCVCAFKLGDPKNSQFYYAARHDEETGALLFSSMWVEKLEKALSNALNKKVSLR